MKKIFKISFTLLTKFSLIDLIAKLTEALEIEYLVARTKLHGSDKKKLVEIEPSVFSYILWYYKWHRFEGWLFYVINFIRKQELV